MGGGCEMSLACDFTYAAEGARLRPAGGGPGIMPGLGGTQLLTRAVGPRRAIEIMTTAAPFTAEKALEWGLVSAVVPAEALMDTVLASPPRSPAARRSPCAASSASCTAARTWT
jgi:enoyl-CoA hydratase/carnithine racemase